MAKPNPAPTDVSEYEHPMMAYTCAAMDARNGPPAGVATPFDPDAFDPDYTATRHDGWTRDRQIDFIEALAENGCVSYAAKHAGISARSAYRFRMKPEAKAFAQAWDNALTLAAVHLTDLAFDRAVNGVLEETLKDGEVVSERRRYSDRLLMFLLGYKRPQWFGKLTGLQNVVIPNLDHKAVSEMPALIAALEDEVTGETMDSDGAGSGSENSAAEA